MTEPKLQAWCNGYECVAAHSKEEAASIVKALGWYDSDEDIDGDGWTVIPDDKMVHNQDGDPPERMGDIVAEKPEARHLYSCEV